MSFEVFSRSGFGSLIEPGWLLDRSRLVSDVKACLSLCPCISQNDSRHERLMMERLASHHSSTPSMTPDPHHTHYFTMLRSFFLRGLHEFGGEAPALHPPACTGHVTGRRSETRNKPETKENPGRGKHKDPYLRLIILSLDFSLNFPPDLRGD